MRGLQTRRLKSSRDDTQQENSSQNQPRTHAFGTTDGEVTVDLSADPNYDLELLTVREAVHR